MAEPGAVIDMIKRIIADDTADLRERIQHLEQRNVMAQPVSIDTEFDHQAATDVAEVVQQTKDLEERLEAIKQLHRLDASPAQWVRDGSGKMVEAPDDLWEITCLGCNYSTVWRKGESKPPQCPTVKIADGQ